MKSTQSDRAVKKSPRLARKRRRIELTKKAAIYSAMFFALLGLIIYGLYRKEVSISEIEVKGTVVMKPSGIIKFAEDELSGKYFFILPEKSIFIFPKSRLENRLRENFKRIKDLDIERAGFTKITITLSERPEHYLWCGRSFIEELYFSDKCYFIDSGGYVFSEAPYYSGGVFLQFYGPLSEGENTKPVGGAVLPEDKFRDLVSFSEALLSLGFRAAKILINPNGDYEIYLDGGGKIIVNGGNDLKKNIEYLELSLATEPLKTKMEKIRDSLDYLDVRFGNKVFYKFK